MPGFNYGYGFSRTFRLRKNLESVARTVLFGANEPGIFLDPSDFSTMFQDATGTTPVTAVGQPVGLVLDKSKGLALGAELRGGGVAVVSGTGPAGSYDTVTGAGRINRTDAINQSRVQFAGLTAGSFYIVDIENTGGALSVRTNTVNNIVAAVNVGVRQTVYVSVVGSEINIVPNNNGSTATFTIHSIRQIAGNHAFQSTAASRPILGRHPANGLRNLATGSANVGPATNWPNSVTLNGITSTKVGSGIDVDGLPYVDVRYQGTGTSTNHVGAFNLALTRIPATSGQTFTSSAFLRLIAGADTSGGLRLSTAEETAPTTYLADTTSVRADAVENLRTATRTVATGNQIRTGLVLVFANTEVVDATYRIKGLQFELGSTRTAYQHNVSTIDVTEPGQPNLHYLAFDGVDDFLITNTITPGIDKAQFFVGVRKLLGTEGQIVELGNGSSNAAQLRANFINTPNYLFASRGDAPGVTLAQSPDIFTAPVTSVLTGIGDILADVTTLRVNGLQQATSAGDQGAGNYLGYPIFIGRRGGVSLPLNGRIYSMICRFGSNLSNYIIGLVEAYVNSKTRAFENLSLESLFSAGEQGLLYDFADFSTLFQDSAGTTPVTAVGQPIGLVLDKSKGLTLGTELRGNAAPYIQGTAPAGTYNPSTGVGSFFRIDLANQSSLRLSGLTVDATYRVDVENTGSTTFTVRTNGGATTIAFIAPGVRTTLLVRVVSTDIDLRGNNNELANFTLHSVRETAGNHASQTTAASRPILGRHPITGLRNLALGSAAVDTSAWITSSTDNGVTVTRVGSGIDPVDGLPYVDLRYQGTATSTAFVVGYSTTRSRVPVTSGQNYWASALVRRISGSSPASPNTLSVGLVEETAPGTYLRGNIGPYPQDSAAEVLCQCGLNVISGNQMRVDVNMRVNTGITVDVTYRIKGLQFELGSTRTAYQHNVSAIDITEPNVPSVHYAAFDGVDDFLVTGTVTPGTDKAQIFAGVRKLSDAASGVVLELSGDASANPGSLGLYAPLTTAPYAFRSRNAGSVTANTAVPYPAPTTDVITGIGDVAGDVTTIRTDGGNAVTVTTDQGVGNYLPYQIFIGRRGGLSTPLNGHIHALALRFGPNLTTDRIAGTERTVNQKTGAY